MPPGINVVVDGFDIYYRHCGLFILSISGRYETPDDISWVNANSKSSKLIFGAAASTLST